MNHLNIFNSFSNKPDSHEDALTRSFLLLLKHIPLVQAGFMELIGKNVPTAKLGSFLLDDLNVSEVYTQVPNSNNIFDLEKISGKRIISIIISDDKLETEKTVKSSERGARYDGVVFCDPDWVFIIENKPSKKNIWIEQLNPNLNNNLDVQIVPEPCCLSWRVIIAFLNQLIVKDMVIGIERALINDFIEYIDSTYAWLNPYTKFGICKDESYLLNKRCISVMAAFNGESEVKYHKGWKYYIDGIDNKIKQIALDSHQEGSQWSVNLWMYAGDTMNSARDVYNAINIEKLKNLLENDSGYSISTNFHLSYRSTGLVWSSSKMCPIDYINYWKKQNIKQVSKEDLEFFLNELIQRGIISSNELDEYNQKILSKKYDKLNVCPGFLIKYTWPKQTTIDLENKNGFEVDFHEKVYAVYKIFDTL